MTPNELASDNPITYHCRDGTGQRCQTPATVRLLDPDGKRVPGMFMCELHAQECIDEYQEKLGETWRMKALP